MNVYFFCIEVTLPEQTKKLSLFFPDRNVNDPSILDLSRTRLASFIFFNVAWRFEFTRYLSQLVRSFLSLLIVFLRSLFSSIASNFKISFSSAWIRLVLLIDFDSEAMVSLLMLSILISFHSFLFPFFGMATL